LAPTLKKRMTFERPTRRAAVNAWSELRGRSRELRFKEMKPARMKSRIPSATERLDEYLAHPALESMEGLTVDWRVEGVEPPNALSRLYAGRILEVADDLGIKPTYVSASAEGGVGICFKRNGLYADIECFNTGEIWALFSDRVNPASTWLVDNTVPKISQALVTLDFKLNPDA
jgi:hypothetical protein